MIRSFVKSHKVVTTLVGVSGVGGISLIDKDRRERAKDACNRVYRTAYFMQCFGRIAFDYWWSFRKLESGTEEYDRMQHVVNERCANQLFVCCNTLGGYFAKFGQAASTLDKGVPEEYVKVLSRCQDQLSPVPFSVLSRVFREDLKTDTSSIFSEIDETPSGCASLAQVHRAVLKDGTVVAVKVQYPAVTKNTVIDLRNVDFALNLAHRIWKSFDFSWLIPKMRSQIESEFNFSREAKSQKECREFFKDSTSVYVPEVYDQFCSERIVTMEFINGVKVNDVDRIRGMGIDPREIADICLEGFSKMIFQAGFLHIDPHPGNLMVRRNPKTNAPQVVILDHGMYVHFRPGFTEQFQKLWLAMITQNELEIREAARPWGLEEYPHLLSMMFTGRQANAKNKIGEQMSDGEREERMKKMQEMMKNMSEENRKMMEERMEKSRRFMRAIPVDLLAILRVQMMMTGLIHLLGRKETDRIDYMTDAAVKGYFTFHTESLRWYSSLQWRLYLYLLKLRLYMNDLFIDLYYRWYMGKGVEFSMPF